MIAAFKSDGTLIQDGTLREGDPTLREGDPECPHAPNRSELSASPSLPSM
jgi:hypothetical protein